MYLRIEWTQRKYRDTIIHTLIISQPVVRVAPAKLAEIRDRIGVPRDAPEEYLDRDIFKNTIIKWPEQPRQLRLPVEV